MIVLTPQAIHTYLHHLSFVHMKARSECLYTRVMHVQLHTCAFLRFSWAIHTSSIFRAHAGML